MARKANITKAMRRYIETLKKAKRRKAAKKRKAAAYAFNPNVEQTIIELQEGKHI